MYAQLSFFSDRPESPWEVEYFALPGAAETVSDHLLKARRLGAMALAKSQTQLNAHAQTELGDRIFQTIQPLPESLGAYSFGAHMALAFHLLPADERLRREAVIASLDGAHLAPAKLAALNEWRLALAHTAVLVPDAALEAVFRSCVGRLFMHLREMPPSDNHINRKTGWSHFEPRLVDYPDLANALALGFFTRRFDERQAFVDLLQSVPTPEIAKLQATIDQDILTTGREPLIADRCEALLGAMRAWRGLPATSRTPDALAAVAAIERERLAMRQSARCTHIVAATLKALAAGTAFGSAVDQKNREAIARYRQSQTPLSRAMALGRRRQPPTPPPAKTSTPGLAPPDLDPVHTWSIDRLVRWIDGPIARAKLPLELGQICATEQKDWEAEQAQRKPEDPLDEGPLKMPEVRMAVEQGLRSTAQFLLDELNDLLPLGAKLQAEAALLKACEGCLPTLSTLVQHGLAREAGDTAQAMAELQRTDLALEALRRGIQQRQGEAQTRQRFTAALFQCLRNEPLLLGKRHGGVIAEPLPLEEWAWAVQTFHKRWWNAGLRPSATEAPMPLAPDQALALYVTGSSLSDHAFDISVHLWRRRAASDLPPTTPAESNAMNEPDWFDTLIPCAVLHVRAKT